MRCLRRALAAAVLGTAAGAACAATPDTLAQRVKACTPCHGDEDRRGSDAYHPRIAGKSEAYLYNQLLNFREGRRHYAPMIGLLDGLPDDYLREIAAHFSRLPVRPAQPRPVRASAAELEHGRRLAAEGDPVRKLPACGACHGAGLGGRPPAIPGLAGLPRDYVNAQLGGWRAGLRKADAPDCMATIAHRMTPRDVSAVSAWIASLPSRPVPDTEQDLAAGLPMDCGSARIPVPDVAESGPAQRVARSAPAPRVADPGPAPSGPVDRGRYLALAGNCAGCHTARGLPAYAGGRGVETPFGTVYASNLTPDDETGLGRWSPDDFWQSLHTGRSRDGRLLYPAFPYPNYTRIAREDSDALFAYLRTLPAVRQPNRPHALRFPYDRQVVLAAWRALFFRPGTFRPDPARSDAWNRGAYLVQGLGHCDACHGERNLLGATATGSALGGGRLQALGWDAPGLASAAMPGRPDWRPADLVSLLATGASRHGSAIGPMAEVVWRSTQHLSLADLEAIAEHLHGLPRTEPVNRRASGAAPPDAPEASEGRTVYERHCADCHGARGEGVPGAYPALLGNQTLNLPSPDNAIRAVLEGGFAPATRRNPRPYGMPPFAPFLGDREIAAALTYARQAWGNRAGPVAARSVGALRGGVAR